jgi:hypothetical protein
MVKFVKGRPCARAFPSVSAARQPEPHSFCLLNHLPFMAGTGSCRNSTTSSTSNVEAEKSILKRTKYMRRSGDNQVNVDQQAPIAPYTIPMTVVWTKHALQYSCCTAHSSTIRLKYTVSSCADGATGECTIPIYQCPLVPAVY